MAAGKEIRGKIKSVENTKKITKAMEMVAASKMRKAQERMRHARPYAEKIGCLAARLAAATRLETHALLANNEAAMTVGFIVVTTDKGLCGGMNANILRALTSKLKEVEASGRQSEAVAIGGKGLGFLNRIGAKVVLHAAQLGDTPTLEKLIGPTKVMLDAYAAGRLSAVYLCYTRFVNTIRQEPVIEPLLPLSPQPTGTGPGWDYLYEPDAATVLENVLLRYTEALVFRAMAENMASEQSARRAAMKAATDNAGDLIGELTLLHNRTRQAAITRELSEIVGGAAAV